MEVCFVTARERVLEHGVYAKGENGHHARMIHAPKGNCSSKEHSLEVLLFKECRVAYGASQHLCHHMSLEEL